MKIPFGNLKLNYEWMKNEIDRSLNEVLQAGWFVLGKQVEEFEKEFAAYCGLPYGVGVNSGTDALYLALLVCGVGEDDEVITVPNTAVPTVCAIRMAGARPVFCDVQEDTLLMNPRLIGGLVTGKTKAIVPVHLYGQMCEMDEIMEVANEHGLKVIEDACQAHGAEWQGLKSGHFGDVACYSFYPSKNLGAYGDGGMIVTKDKDYADRIKMLRNYGQKERYENVVEGINSRLDEIQAALLRAKLPHLDEWNRRRREIANRYRGSHSHSDIKHPIEKKAARHVFHLYVIQTTKRDDLQQYLKNRGIGTIIHYPAPIYRQPAYSYLDVSRIKCPVSEQAVKRILSIPIYPELTDEQVQYIIDCMNSWEG